MAFHINSKGEAGKCKATQGGCPFGDSDQHYATAAEAQQAFEQSQETFSKPQVEQPFTDLGPGWKDDEQGTYADALAEAKKLKADGKFVVITTSYSAVDENFEEEPEADDYDDEEDYEEALADWQDAQSDISSVEELASNYPKGLRSYAAESYDSLEAFEASVKDMGVPGSGGAGEAFAVLDEESSDSSVYKSVPEVGVTNNHMAWYFEARVF
jgi:hypothetical protein